ncbi:MAG: ATP-binding cassette domain-containing protein, partial [Bacteroidota bacterium]
MFSLSAKNLSKRFYRQWVFRDLSFGLDKGEHLLITGSNGSGKSTLMHILAGQLTPTRGEYRLLNGKRRLDYGEYYRFISWSGPYMDLYADLTVEEAIRLHFRFHKPLLPLKDIPTRLHLAKDRHKPLRHFSSGMLHRVKVGLAIFSDSRLLLLDEATTNMDA